MTGRVREARPLFDTANGWHSGAHAFLVLLCVVGGYVAHLNSRPVTSALALIFAVVLVATRYGLRAGLAAGIIVSMTYNLLFSDPFLRFGVRDIEDLIPLLAFNASAVASAYVGGRLRDEARRSREALDRVDALLDFSQALQKAVSLQDMLTAARQSGEIEAVELHLDDGRTFTAEAKPDLKLIAERFRDQGPGQISAPNERLYLADRFGRCFLVVLTTRRGAIDVNAKLAILAIAAERWLLTEELVKADVLRRSEDFKTTLLSSVSHDLRTPLSIITASAGSLLRYQENLTEEARRDLLKTIEQQSTKLNQLTGNLLSLVRIEGGLDLTQMATVDALEVLGSALVTIRQFAPDRTITKDLRVGEAIVRADPSLLEQVFINLLKNAVVHTPADTPIHVTSEREPHQVRIAIEDNGPGVLEESAELVFKRFQQAPGRPNEGSGLGLSIARGFARTIGGDVRVGRRADGQSGARFEVCLPLILSETAE